MSGRALLSLVNISPTRPLQESLQRSRGLDSVLWFAATYECLASGETERSPAETVTRPTNPIWALCPYWRTARATPVARRVLKLQVFQTASFKTFNPYPGPLKLLKLRVFLTSAFKTSVFKTGTPNTIRLGGEPMHIQFLCVFVKTLTPPCAL